MDWRFDNEKFQMSGAYCDFNHAVITSDKTKNGKLWHDTVNITDNAQRKDSDTSAHACSLSSILCLHQMSQCTETY